MRPRRKFGFPANLTSQGSLHILRITSRLSQEPLHGAFYEAGRVSWFCVIIASQSLLHHCVPSLSSFFFFRSRLPPLSRMVSVLLSPLVHCRSSLTAGMQTAPPRQVGLTGGE